MNTMHYAKRLLQHYFTQYLEIYLLEKNAGKPISNMYRDKLRGAMEMLNYLKGYDPDLNELHEFAAKIQFHLETLPKLSHAQVKQLIKEIKEQDDD